MTDVPTLIAGGQAVALGRRPLIMGVVNATADSFSDAGRFPTLESRLDEARRQLRGGAAIVDVGGQSAVTDRPEVDAREEVDRVVPLVERIVRELGALVSVDTYKLDVARAALSAGARIVNDTSGLRDVRLAQLCAEHGAGLVVMHNLSRPKERLTDPGLYDDVVAECVAFLEARLAAARDAGLPAEATIVDPGPDFAKTPAQTVAVLRGLDAVHALGRPVLLALSRKDFVGALTGRPPRERLAGTLAAIGHVPRRPGQILRVHDVPEVSDYLTVADALTGESPPDDDLRLHPDLRREPRPGG